MVGCPWSQTISFYFFREGGGGINVKKYKITIVQRLNYYYILVPDNGGF